MALLLLCLPNMKGQEFLQIEKLNSVINSPQYDESAPVLSLDGTILFFTRTGYPDFDHTLMDNGIDLSKSLPAEIFNERLKMIYQSLGGIRVNEPSTSSLNQDIWYAKVADTLNIEMHHPPYPANNALPNSIVSTAIDTGEYLTINQFYKDGSMYAGFSTVTQYSNGQFSFPKPLHIYGFETQAGDVNMSMSYDGDILIISMRRYDSIGENDLYVSFRMRPNVYTEPRHMGVVLNTNGQETTPYISRDKRRLYFSSNREGSLGGNDLYYSQRIDYTWLRWEPPIALEEPFNSTFDDSQPFLDEVNGYLYFSSKRDGSSDIYRVSRQPIPEPIGPLKIYGQIVNKRTGKLMQAELLYGPISAKGYLEYFSTRTGVFETVIENGETFKFFPYKRKFDSQQITLDASIAVKSGKDELQLILYLDPLEIDSFEIVPVIVDTLLDEDPVMPEVLVEQEEKIIEFGQLTPADLKVGQRISFYDIRFVRSQATILKRSTKALLALHKTLSDISTLEIIIEGHTDNIGDVEKNVLLSEQRAESVKRFLVKKGISEHRIETKGFGPHRPVSSNSVESQRQKNRRVEIRILKK